MNEEYFKLLLSLNLVNRKLKLLSAEVEEIISKLANEDFDNNAIVFSQKIIKSEDFE